MFVPAGADHRFSAYEQLACSSSSSADDSRAAAAADAVVVEGLCVVRGGVATTEFQAVQFMPAIVLPQFLLCGLFVAREDMAAWLRALSAVLPLTYAYDALARVASGGPYGTRFAVDVAVVLGSIGMALVLAAATLRRRTD